MADLDAFFLSASAHSDNSNTDTNAFYSHMQTSKMTELSQLSQ